MISGHVCCIRTIGLWLTFIPWLAAMNPITPPGTYLADPTARVLDDGRVVIYGSVDEQCEHYCSYRLDALVSEDLEAWTLHPGIFHSRGENDRLAGTDATLFAPDVIAKDGRHYLYYCTPDRNHAEGVAESTDPLGPFEMAEKLDLGSWDEIDPGVFIDDDGQAYYLWGQFSLKMAKLDSSMRAIDLSSLKTDVLTEGEHFFHEGAFLFKRAGVYYLVYADISRADMPTCLGYATSDHPMGPYTYRGVIIDNRQCNPGNWNNHGSVAEVGGQWYVFYHRSTHGCNTMRKTCVEPISFRDDGSIPEVPMTTQGVGSPLALNTRIEAASACLLFGGATIRLEGPEHDVLADIQRGDKAAYKYVDFDKGARQVEMRLKAGPGGGQLWVQAGQPWHRSIARIEVPAGGDTDWQTVRVPTDPEVKGVQAVWLYFRSEPGESWAVDWFTFHSDLAF